MNSTEALGRLNCGHKPFIFPLQPKPPILFRPVSSVSFRAPFPPSPSPFLIELKTHRVLPLISMNAAPSSSSPSPNPQNPKPLLAQFHLPLLRTTLIAAVTAAVFFARFNLRPAITAPISPPSAAAAETAVAEEEKQNESDLELSLESNPDDVDALRKLMEIKFRSKKLEEAIEIVERLMRLEPDEGEWPLFKAHMHCYAGDVESAKMGFDRILEKEPLRVEAYHGLVTAAMGSDWRSELAVIEKRMEEAMELCRKEKRKEELRDFKLLLAQIRVIDGKIDEALGIYRELVKEDPRDFRPYLCQGLIYKSMGKETEADKWMQKYRKLVPKGHPYAALVDDFIGKGFGQKKVDREEARS